MPPFVALFVVVFLSSKELDVVGFYDGHIVFFKCAFELWKFGADFAQGFWVEGVCVDVGLWCLYGIPGVAHVVDVAFYCLGSFYVGAGGCIGVALYGVNDFCAGGVSHAGELPVVFFFCLSVFYDLAAGFVFCLSFASFFNVFLFKYSGAAVLVFYFVVFCDRHCLPPPAFKVGFHFAYVGPACGKEVNRSYKYERYEYYEDVAELE